MNLFRPFCIKLMFTQQRYNNAKSCMKRCNSFFSRLSFPAAHRLHIKWFAKIMHWFFSRQNLRSMENWPFCCLSNLPSKTQMMANPSDFDDPDQSFWKLKKGRKKCIEIGCFGKVQNNSHAWVLCTKWNDMGTWSIKYCVRRSFDIRHLDAVSTLSSWQNGLFRTPPPIIFRTLKNWRKTAF